MKKPPARKQMDEAQMKEVENIEDHVIKLIFDVPNFHLFSTSIWICKSKQIITRGISKMYLCDSARYKESQSLIK